MSEVVESKSELFIKQIENEGIFLGSVKTMFLLDECQTMDVYYLKDLDIFGIIRLSCWDLYNIEKPKYLGKSLKRHGYMISTGFGNFSEEDAALRKMFNIPINKKNTVTCYEKVNTIERSSLSYSVF